jgi:hypothetical protein
MQTYDYNGSGKWSAVEILRRYDQYCRELKVPKPLNLAPHKFAPLDSQGSAPITWVYPVIHKVIPGIEQGDEACKRIGIEFIEEDQTFPFGRILKSNTARALRRTYLSPTNQERIRKRVVDMLLAGHVPREYREYAKLLRTVGIGSYWPMIESRTNRDNPYVMRWYNYFKTVTTGLPSAQPPPHPSDHPGQT